MKWHRTLTGISVCVLAFPSLFVAQPRLLIEGGTKISLGTIHRGEIVERKLEVRNTGTDTLEVSSVTASCGCTAAMISSPRLAPGERGTLNITFNSKNFTGDVRKTVTLRSNCDDSPTLVIEFTASVVDEVVYSPPQFWFKDAEVGKTSRSTVRIRNKSDQPLTLKGARITAAGFTLPLPDHPLKPGEEVELVLSFTPTKEIPFIAEGVFLATSNPYRGELYIPIYGNAKVFKFE
jgi:hypothetical protein